MEDELKKTEEMGADPKNGAEVKEGENKETPPVSEEMPWHKDARFKNELGLLKAAKSIMEANGLDDLDDLKDLVESGKKVHGKKVDLNNLDEIVRKAAMLDQYEIVWAQQRSKQQENEETPDQTIERLKREKADISSQKAAKDKADRDAQMAKEAVELYESEVTTALEVLDGFGPEEKAFISWSLGVGNECNAIDITDKRQVKKTLTNGVKRYQKLVEEIKAKAITEYRSGKAGVPKVPATDGSAATTKPTAPKGLAALRAAFKESLKSKGE